MTVGADGAKRGYDKFSGFYGSMDDDTFTHGGTSFEIRRMRANATDVHIRLSDNPGSNTDLVLELAGETLPLANGTVTSNGANRTYTWDQTWLTNNASSLTSSDYTTTLTTGGTVNVCVRTTTQSCSTNTAPDAPTDLTAGANGQNAIDLSWTAPSNTGGAAITGYKIEVSADGGTTWSDVVANTSSTGTTYSHTGLSAGNVRHYRVSAINSVGTGDASDVAGAITATADGTFAVASDWGLKPSAVAAGSSFRLLFLSSTKRDPSSTDIADYNAFIQNRAASGHSAIQIYGSHFRVVGCTDDDDARDNTATTYTASEKGVPIYWLNGAKAADDYEDFYDGSWDDEANDKNESGNNGPDTSQLANFPLTGCEHDGTAASFNSQSRALGASSSRVGAPNNSALGHGPLSSNGNVVNDHPFYGLSPVFTVPQRSP